MGTAPRDGSFVKQARKKPLSAKSAHTKKMPTRNRCGSAFKALFLVAQCSQYADGASGTWRRRAGGSSVWRSHGSSHQGARGAWRVAGQGLSGSQGMRAGSVCRFGKCI